MSFQFPNRALKTRLTALATAAALTLGVMQPAHALFGVGDIVLDPVNLVQNTMTAARTLEQINNQIRQLQNEAQMLINQARNLASLPFNVVNRLRSTLDTTRQLIAQAQGLTYQVSNLDAEFRSAAFRLLGEKRAHVDAEAADFIIARPGAQHLARTAAKIEHTGPRFQAQRLAESDELFGC